MTVLLDHDPRGPGATTVASPPVVDADRRGLRWWREVGLVLAFYAAYSFVRGQFGSATGHTAQAFDNATTILQIERFLGIDDELAIQRWFLQWPVLVRGLNIFYGLFHFIVPVVVLVLLYRVAPAAYRRGRDALAAATGLALVGFALFPLMPPRLLCTCPYGAGLDEGFVDTLARYGGLWSFGSHGVGAVSNQYAAMPSLHFAWALWCAIAIGPLLAARPGWRRLAFVYPALTLLAVVVTANHFWLDAVGGAVVVGAGYGVAAVLARARRPWRAADVRPVEIVAGR